MRPLVVDDQARAAVNRVIDYAMTHPYHLSIRLPPGDNPGFVVNLDSYRCVFTFSHANDRVWRHLSISVPSEKYPNPAAAFTIATLFGFTGWDERTIDKMPNGWHGDVNEREHCIVLVQQIAGAA